MTGADFTGADFTEVDVDLLADYVGGALEGTPDEARVAALIAGEPAWRDAHALLSEGMAEVGDSLRSWGTAPEPMPADVIVRLDAALGETGGVAAASGAAPAAVRSNVVDLDSRRRRTRRWGGSFAAAAAVLAVGGVGIAYLGSTSSSSNDSASSSSAGEAKSAAGGIAQLSAGEVTSSNTDYDASSLRDGAVAPLSADSNTAPPAAPQSLKSSPATSGNSARAPDGLADALARLRPQPALQACLDDIAAENGVGSITVQSVDYARYNGEPALIVRFTAANGQWAWASRAGCGLPNIGANTAYRVKVG